MLAHQRSATPSTTVTSARYVILALVAVAVIAAVLAVAIVLTAAGGGSGDDGGPVRVVPSAPLPPSPAERGQPPGQWGPGMRP